MAKKVAVILSGCGHQDGSEIRESVITILELDRQGAKYEFFAPDIEQKDVINHLTGKPMKETRNVLVEAARIARGKISPLTSLKVDKFDAIMLPGGYGAAKNLSDLAENGAKAHVAPDLEAILLKFMEQRKPIGAVCIAPAIVALALANNCQELVVTIGDDTEDLISAIGASHVACEAEDAVVDENNMVITAPAYMLDAPLANIADGIGNVVEQLLALA